MSTATENQEEQEVISIEEAQDGSAIVELPSSIPSPEPQASEEHDDDSDEADEAGEADEADEANNKAEKFEVPAEIAALAARLVAACREYDLTPKQMKKLAAQAVAEAFKAK